MIISASGLKLRNVGQLVEFVHNRVAIMGRIENVMIAIDTRDVALRIAGHGKTFNLPGEGLLNIIRTTEAYEAMQSTLVLEDMLSKQESNAY